MATTTKIGTGIGHATDEGNDGRYALNGVLVGESCAMATDGRIAAVVMAGTDKEWQGPVLIPGEIAPKAKADSKAVYKTNGNLLNVARTRPGKPDVVATVKDGRFPKLQECFPPIGTLDMRAVVKIDAEKLLKVAKAINKLGAENAGMVTLIIQENEESAIIVLPNDEGRGAAGGIGLVMPLYRDTQRPNSDTRDCDLGYYVTQRKHFQGRVSDAVDAWNKGGFDRALTAKE